ncbi:MAG TPA: oxygen-independent coproporphyrinogen III oxidase-like protein [Gammaproteobacteria bacterium]|nr:oxygen-independent coproporphyrinogen III oxidase-like protein [Gammaproteobacteria bacterium]
MFHFQAAPPLSLYIHFPWCVRKCPYCDFNSHAVKDELPQKDYIDALLCDLEQELPRIWGRRVSSVFLGGGTPSLFDPEHMDRLLGSVRALLSLNPDAEITLEANPGTLAVPGEHNRFAEYRDAGINRVSLGIQSFDERMLQRLGRVHTSSEAHAAIELLQRSGFSNYNLDLMHGLPGQSEAQALRDLAIAMDYQPPHLSWYQLTIEPNTAYHASPPALPDEDQLAAIQDRGTHLLIGHGYQHYEVSAWAREAAQCRHNLNYWRFGDYLGIGAGAHDKITNVPEQTITRRWKQKHPIRYLETASGHDAVGGERVLSRDDAAFEFMLNALRLVDGFPTALFGERTGLPILMVQPQLEAAVARGWLEWDTFHLRPTEHGQHFLNDLVGLFLPDDHAA